NPSPLVWLAMAHASPSSVAQGPPAAVAILDSGGPLSMILLAHPRSTRPKNRRFPLSVLALAAVLEGREEYEIVDGNSDPDPMATIAGIISRRAVDMLGVSLMPGPQMVAAMALS